VFGGRSVSPDADMELIGEYDEIEIPPVKPVVRHRRFACRCEHCGSRIKAPAPAVRSVSTILRQPVLEFKLGFLRVEMAG
jgi:transposase